MHLLTIRFFQATPSNEDLAHGIDFAFFTKLKFNYDLYNGIEFCVEAPAKHF